MEMWDENFMKRHLDLFCFITFALEYDKTEHSLSRIGLIRRCSDDLSHVDSSISATDIVKNDSVCYEFCKQV